MVTPKIGKPISVTAANVNIGAKVIAFNRTTNEQITSTLTRTGQAILDMQNFASGFTTSDVIEFRVNGKYFGENTVTLTADTAAPQNVTLTTTQTTTTNAPAINF